MQKNPIAALIALSVSLFLAGCEEPTGEADVQGLDEAAEHYVHLVLAVGEIEPGYVDAYYGPEEWRQAVAEDQAGAESLLQRARDA